MEQSFLGFVLSVTTLEAVVKDLLKVIAILIGTWVALRCSNLLIDRAMRPRREDKKYYFEEKRAKTLGGLLKSILRYTVYFIAAMMILEVFEIKTASILAGAGIIGLAVGFGAQSLTRDVINGFFIIFEDQYAVGDYITTAGVAGIVEEMGLRITKLRDFGGELHIIPNSEIKKVTNHTRGSMQAVVNVGVAYEEDLEHVLGVLDLVAEQVAREIPEVVEGPHVLGVVDFAEAHVVVRIVAKTLALQQWKVERELRRRIKDAFDRENISFSTRTLGWSGYPDKQRRKGGENGEP